MDNLLILMRFVQFTSVMTLLGSSLFPWYALKRKGVSRGCRDDVEVFIQKTGFYASFAALFSAIVWFGCEANLMSGDENGYLKSSIISKVFSHTEFGHLWIFRLILLVILVAIVSWRYVKSRNPKTTVILLFALPLVIGLAGVGHGAMGVGFDAWIHLGNQALHLLAASIWVGGLWPLFYITWRVDKAGLDTELLISALKRFSTVGLLAVLVILGSGLVNAWFLVGSIDALFATAYGHVLLIKLSFFCAMILLAISNRLYLMPKLEHNDHVEERVRVLVRSIAFEQIFALLVVASVSVLGNLPPAFDRLDMTM